MIVSLHVGASNLNTGSLEEQPVILTWPISPAPVFKNCFYCMCMSAPTTCVQCPWRPEEVCDPLKLSYNLKVWMWSSNSFSCLHLNVKPHLVFEMLGIKPRVLCVLCKHQANWATSESVDFWACSESLFSSGWPYLPASASLRAGNKDVSYWTLHTTIIPRDQFYQQYTPVIPALRRLRKENDGFKMCLNK